MRVLLTGANGFVGSHILDRLRADRLETVIFLRRGSDTQFITGHLAHVEVRTGALDDPSSLRAALEGVTHVVHCAGATKALRADGLFQANQIGTRNLVHAVNDVGDQIQRFVHLSSLAAGRSGTVASPATEADSPAPLSEYGRSKLAGEREVTGACRREFTVLRPSAVYGPRDREFLPLFKAAACGLTPVFAGGRQELSLAFAPDLAEVAVRALTSPAAVGKTFNVASAEVVTAGALAASVSQCVGKRPLRLSFPGAVLDLVCALSATWARLVRKPTVLAHGKRYELAAPGWVCDTARVRAALGPVCSTPLKDGLATTLAWYREQQWM